MARRRAAACVLVLLAGACEESRGAAPSMAARAQEQALRIVLVSELRGVLEPCGCGGRPAGGVDRVVAAVDALRAERPASLVLGVGQLSAPVRSPADAQEPQAARWKAEAMGHVLRRLRLDARADAGKDRAAGRLVAGPVVLGLLAASWPPSPTGEANGDSSVSRLAAEVRALRARGARVVVVAIDGSATRGAQASELGALGADLVVQSGLDADEPAATPLGAHGWLIRPSRHGEAISSVELRLTDSGPVVARVTHHVLDAEAPADPEVRAMLTRLFARIATHHAPEATLAAPAPRAAGLAYVGSETCAACHTAAYYEWRASAHGRALTTLVGRGRQHDYECVGCHVTGWDEGAPTLRGLEQRAGVGCESCHGPGSAHVQAPRAPHRGFAATVPEARCRECHDRDHSRNFDDVAYRAELLTPAHGGR